MLSRRMSWFACIILLSVNWNLFATPSSDAAGDNADALRAIELCKQGKTRDAMPFFENALRRSPGDAQLFYNRGLAYQTLGEIDKAIKDYSKCLNISPLTKKAYYNRALAYISKKDYTQAKRDLDRATVIDPKYAEAYASRANIYFNFEKYREAIRDFDKSLECAPKAQTYIDKGNTEHRMGLFPQAAIDYAEAIKTDPTLTKALSERALLFLCQQKYTAAIRDASKYVELRGLSDQGTPYTLFIKLFAAKLSKDAAAEKNSRDSLKKIANGSDWPSTIASFLIEKSSADELLKSAGKDVGKQTEAHAYIGMALFCAGKTVESKNDFNWVAQNGDRMYDEFTLAKSMLRQIK